MKRRYITYGVIMMIGAGLLVSCKKSFLELLPKGQSLESNYYSTPDQVFAGLVAAYDPLVTETGGINNTYSGPLGPLNSASDDCYAGGGGSGDMTTWQAWNNYTLNSAVGPQGEYWRNNFRGVARTNILISKLEKVTFLDDATKKRYMAEAKFLRAHYYFDLVRLFKNVPLIVGTVDPNTLYDVEQAAPEAVYQLVESDLTAAIPDLPPTVGDTEKGRITQGAGKALLGKVYLYQKKWSNAAAQLADVNGPTPGGTTPVYGYKLMDKFGDIFSPDHKFNSESIFELTHTNTQNYTWNNWGSFKSNVYVQMVGPRGYNGPVYWGGWGFNPVTKQLHDFMKGDPRYGYTLYDLDSLTAANNISYEHSYQNTGYFLQKYAPLLKYKSPTGTAELNFPNNYIEIRLADTYLMEAEALLQSGGNAGRALALLSAVRERVGLTPVAATLENVYTERRKELATEGHRWFDLVRWGQAPTALAFKGFKAGTNEILPIPLPDLANTKLKQNPGYN